MDDKFSNDKPLNIPEPTDDLSEQCSELAPKYIPDLKAGPTDVLEPELDDESSDEFSNR